MSLEGLPLQQRQAVAAYQGGHISLSRLAKAVGMHVLELRPWLGERGVEQRNAYSDADTDNA